MGKSDQDLVKTINTTIKLLQDIKEQKKTPLAGNIFDDIRTINEVLKFLIVGKDLFNADTIRWTRETFQKINPSKLIDTINSTIDIEGIFKALDATQRHHISRKTLSASKANSSISKSLEGFIKNTEKIAKHQGVDENQINFMVSTSRDHLAAFNALNPRASEIKNSDLHGSFGTLLSAIDICDKEFNTLVKLSALKANGDNTKKILLQTKESFNILIDVMKLLSKVCSYVAKSLPLGIEVGGALGFSVGIEGNAKAGSSIIKIGTLLFGGIEVILSIILFTLKLSEKNNAFAIEHFEKNEISLQLIRIEKMLLENSNNIQKP